MSRKQKNRPVRLFRVKEIVRALRARPPSAARCGRLAHRRTALRDFAGAH